MIPSERADLARTQIADLIDAQLGPLGRAAIDALNPQPGERIIDIGCRAGQTLLQLADRVARSGHVTGVDIATPSRTRVSIGFIPASASWLSTTPSPSSKTFAAC